MEYFVSYLCYGLILIFQFLFGLDGGVVGI